MPIYLGAKKLDEIYLGSTGISKIYLGTTLVYDKGGGPTPPSAGVLYDNGFVTGISWQGNYLPRPPYTSIASYNFEASDMALIVASEENYSNVNHTFGRIVFHAPVNYENRTNFGSGTGC